MRKLLGSAVLVSLLSAAGLYAAPACRNSDFKGVYGLLARGPILYVPDPFSPLIGSVIRLARVVSDGAGNVSVQSHASYNGFIVEEPFGGTYTVNPDCTIVLDLQVPLPIIIGDTVVGLSPPVPFQFAGALADSGTDVSVGVTMVAGNPPGSVLRVHLRRQDNDYGQNDDKRLACSERNLTGSYQLDLYGEVSDTTKYPWPTLPPPFDTSRDFSREGVLTFDGRGGFSGKTVANYGGMAIVPEPLTGTYTVDGSCNVTVNYGLDTHSQSWVGVITDGGKGANLLVTSPQGAVIGGTLLKQ